MDKKKIVIIILIILLVLSVGLNLFLFNFIIETVKENYCNTQINTFFNSELNEFTNALENTANNQVESKVIFGNNQNNSTNSINSAILSIGYDSLCDKYLTKKIINKIDTITNSNQCSAKCGVPQDSCFSALIYSTDIPNGFHDQCVQLPIYTSFMPKESCDLIEGYSIIDPRDEIPFGNYIFRNVAQSGETYPKMCIYYKPFE